MSRKHKKPYPSVSAPRDSRLRAAALVICGILAGLLAAEGASRLIFRKNVAELAMTEADLYYYYDPAGVRRHIPNKTGFEAMWNGDGKAEFRINSLGFRGREVSQSKRPGTFRILFVGDSITLGGRLPEGEIFVEKVGRALGSPGYEVVNAGFGDIGLAEEEEVLKTTGLGLAPDLVVLCWYLNDGRPPVGFPEEIVYRNRLIRGFHASGWLRRSYFLGLLYGTLRKSLVTRQIKLSETRSQRFRWTDAYMKGDWASNPAAFAELARLAAFDWGDAWNPASREAMFARVRAMRKLALARGAKFALVALPLHAQVHAGFSAPVLDEPQRELLKFCGVEGMPCLDLLPRLRERRGKGLFYDNCHYTPDGNTVVAEEIVGFLRKTVL